MATDTTTRNTLAAVASLVLVMLTQIAGCVMGEKQKATDQRVENLERGQQEIKAKLEERLKRIE